MAEEWPKIRSRRTIAVSQWMDVIAREVEFKPGSEPEIYHAVSQQDYLGIVALTPDGRIPVVRQYRPAVETFTWELPAGLVERGEDPAAAASRELLEETGYPTLAIHALGAPAFACTGRLSNLVHSFFIKTGEQVSGFKPEPGLAVELKSPAELAMLIKSGAFVQQMHLGVLMLADLGSFLTLPK